MDLIYQLGPILLMLVLFYFMLIRPQQKKQKETQRMRDGISNGDQVVTIGGIYGTVTAIKDEQVTIQVGADKSRFVVAKWAVGSVVAKNEKENA
jgi:preprotein translocase subunit YajC